MIVDFQHHFTPRELLKEDPGDRRIIICDENGAPASTVTSLLYDLDEHVRMMDYAGIDAAVLSSPAGMGAPVERARIVNDKTRQAVRDYPGRFIGTAHIHPLGGSEALYELARCKHELGFPGVVITSEVDGNWLDAPEFEPFWSEAEKLELFVFIHPVLALNDPRRYDAYDIGRSVGREFSLIMATVRLINSGVLDRHPKLVVQMSHLAGGIATMLGRLRSYQDKEFWGTAGHPLHGKKSERDLDYYINERIVFDVGGFCGEVNSVKAGLAEIPASRMVFATDYPQEIRGHAEVRDYVSGLRALGSTGEQILSGNVSSLLNGLEEANLAAIR